MTTAPSNPEPPTPNPNTNQEEVPPVLTPPTSLPHKIINPPSSDAATAAPQTQNYAPRFAYRIVASNPEGKIAISHPWENFRYRLPGGYTDPSTASLIDNETVTRHELEWETGGRIRLKEDQSSAIAWTEEFREDVSVRQVTWCYLGELVPLDKDDGDSVTDEMLDRKLKLEWMSVEEARERVEREEATTEVGRVVKERDWFFLDVATGGLVGK